MTTLPQPSRPRRRLGKTTDSTPDPARVGFGQVVAWSSSHASQAVNFLVLSFFAIYCTDTLGLAPAVVGGLLFASKLVEAVGVLFAGYLVDISPQTRFGKARPFDLFIVAVWVVTALMFSTPGGLGDTAKYVWVFTTYLLVTAVFTPLFLANQPLYMARSFENREAYTKVSSLSGIVIGAAALLVGILFPIFIARVGKSPSGWSVLVLSFGLAFAVFGLLRFLTIKERFPTDASALPKLQFSDVRAVLTSNPYLWTLAGIQFLISFFGNFGALTYYFRYIVGDVAIQGLLGITAVLILPTLAFLPRLVARFTVSRLIVICALIGTVGYSIYTFAGASVPLLAVAGILTALGTLPVSFLLPVLIIDNSVYNEWKGNRRLESVGGGVASFAMYFGAGISAGVTGLVLGAAGYDGTQSVQQPSAVTGIIALNSWIPAALSLVTALLAVFYLRFERQLPTITASVEARRAGTPTEHALPSIGFETTTALEAERLSSPEKEPDADPRPHSTNPPA